MKILDQPLENVGFSPKRPAQKQRIKQRDNSGLTAAITAAITAGEQR
jgi:hypothetical protein